VAYLCAAYLYRDVDDSARANEQGHGELLITAQGNSSVCRGYVVDLEGRRIGSGSRVTLFHSVPSQLVLSPGHPYLLSLQPTCIEVHNTTTAGTGRTHIHNTYTRTHPHNTFTL
jgi:hypothetical protein